MRTRPKWKAVRCSYVSAVADLKIGETGYGCNNGMVVTAPLSSRKDDL